MLFDGSFAPPILITGVNQRTFIFMVSHCYSSILFTFRLHSSSLTWPRIRMILSCFEWKKGRRLFGSLGEVTKLETSFNFFIRLVIECPNEFFMFYLFPSLLLWTNANKFNVTKTTGTKTGNGQMKNGNKTQLEPIFCFVSIFHFYISRFPFPVLL